MDDWGSGGIARVLLVPGRGCCEDFAGVVGERVGVGGSALKVASFCCGVAGRGLGGVDDTGFGGAGDGQIRRVMVVISLSCPRTGVDRVEFAACEEGLAFETVNVAVCSPFFDISDGCFVFVVFLARASVCSWEHGGYMLSAKTNISPVCTCTSTHKKQTLMKTRPIISSFDIRSQSKSESTRS